MIDITLEFHPEFKMQEIIMESTGVRQISSAIHIIEKKQERQ